MNRLLRRLSLASACVASFAFANSSDPTHSTNVASGDQDLSLSAGEYPICKSKASDPDGDGWGWEYNKSCQVAGELPPTPGCDKSGAETGVRTKGLSNRSYVLSVPTNYQSSQRYALIFGWHGYGLDGYQMRSFMEKLEQLSDSRAIFVYPNARNKSWEQSGSDFAFFDQMVNELSNQYCIDKSRISSVGFSNGAFFTNLLAQNRPAMIRAIVSVAGGGGGGLPMQAMVIHGNQDRWVSYSSGAASISNWAKANSCSTAIDYSARGSCYFLSNCRSEFQTAFCPWAADHDWPRFQNADAQIWQFLQ